MALIYLLCTAKARVMNKEKNIGYGNKFMDNYNKTLGKNAESFQKDDGPERYRKSGPNKDPENE